MSQPALKTNDFDNATAREQRCPDCLHLKRANECRPAGPGERPHWQRIGWTQASTMVLPGGTEDWMGRWCKRFERRPQPTGR